MGRARREGYPPPPTDYENANDSLLSERYSAKEFTKYYQGLVYGAGEGEKALIFASLENIAKLGEATKTILSDATFNTVHDDGYTPMQFLRVARYTFASSNKKYFKQLQESI